jgi:hypothetical protein
MSWASCFNEGLNFLSLGEAERILYPAQAKAGTKVRWFYDSRIIKSKNAPCKLEFSDLIGAFI